MADLGKRLRELREKNNMSIYDVERKTSLHFSTISKYERNERTPSLNKLLELAEAYQVPPGVLLSNEEEILSFLPAELRENARKLMHRTELSELIGLIELLEPEQVKFLVGFLRSMVQQKVPPRPQGKPFKNDFLDRS